MTEIKFTLSYSGNDAENHQLDFYDAAQAMIGFQRSLAITTHLILNGEVITQAPSLKNARIVAVPPEEGSWKIPATIIFLLSGGVYKLGTAPKDTPVGHLVHSAYDYVISETMGFHVDYDKSLGQQYEELEKKQQSEIPIIKQSQLDSVIEKCEYNIQEMHRPIVKSKTASQAKIIFQGAPEQEEPFEYPLKKETYNFIRYTEQSSEAEEISGRISSYNINTYKGRIFVRGEQRPLPFQLADTARTSECINKITRSLTANARDRFVDDGNVTCIAYRNYGRSGHLKGLYIEEVK